MDDGPIAAHFPNGQYNSGPNGNNSIKQGDDQFSRPQYSIPGILHFIQHEWSRFELERSHWEIERAELQARIAFLQGERKAQENLKNDLIRRIKMLEYALKQERAKFNKLKYGTELTDGKVSDFGDFDDGMKLEPYSSPNSNVSWRQGRTLLRQYLQEIGYTDTVIEVRSNRVRQLLGMNGTDGETEKERMGLPTFNGEQPGKRPIEIQGGRRLQGKKPTGALGDGSLLENEAAVLDSFKFLPSDNVDMDEDDEEGDDGDDLDDAIEKNVDKLDVRPGKPRVHIDHDAYMDNDTGSDEDTEEALAEFDFLGPDGPENDIEGRQPDGLNEDWRYDEQRISKLKEQYKKERKGKKNLQRPKRSTLQAMLANLGSDSDAQRNSGMSSISPPTLIDADEAAIQGNPALSFPQVTRRPLVTGLGPEDETFEAALGLGELAGITVSNESDAVTYDIDDIAAGKDTFRKTWNAKYTLRSHFDGVRALVFHPVEPVLITAAEDHTLKLWNLQKTVPAKKAASLDVEPIYTFRGHLGPVLSLAMSATGEECFSGGLDSTIQCWSIPSSNVDPYDSFDPAVLTTTLYGHTDAVWGLSIHSSRMQLLSSSADGTVRLWQPQSKDPLLKVYNPPSDDVPSSVDFVRCDPNQMVAAYQSCTTSIFDLETGKTVVNLDTINNTDIIVACTINKLISHPTLPVTITAYDDRHIRFFDNNTGKMIHSMVAHLDSVTSLAIDPNGLYLLSGSHDCSIRLWNLESKTCIQEITSHRKKFDESIYDVAFHPTKPYIASAGADALAKVFI